MKRLFTILAAFLCGAMLLAQEPTGGVKGVVVSRGDRQPIENARLVLLKGPKQTVRS